MSLFPSTSVSLLARAQAHDPDAWRRLVDLYGPLVYHWCRRGRLGPEDTADVFQEVFGSVAQHLPAFHRDRAGDTFRGWLRTITSNKLRDLFRARQGQQPAAGGSEALRTLQAVPDPLAAGDDPEEENLASWRVRQALGWIERDFEERTWRAFRLARLEGRDTAEVAAELGVSPAAVRKACYRVMDRLRQELEGLA
jgi:RNA polymerase sigma-70 factor (ECF subfamily)